MNRIKSFVDVYKRQLQGGWGGQVASTVSCRLPFVAVTGDDHEKLEPIVTNYGFEAIRNDHPELGQGVSIAMGVRHLMNTSSIPLDGILCSCLLYTSLLKR